MNEMWPSSITLEYLLFGLTPLFFVAWWAARNGFDELMSLRSVTVVLLWIGYQLSPWIAYLQGGYWQSYLLSPYYIDTASMFATLSTFSVLLGYSLVFGRREAASKRRLALAWTVPSIPRRWVIAASLILLALTIYNVGGLVELWSASYYRGEGQWDERTLFVVVDRALHVIEGPLVVAVALLSSFHLLKSPLSGSRFVVGVFGVIVASLPAMHAFSRMAGFPLLLLSFLILRYRRIRMRELAIVIVLTLIAMNMGKVGFDERGSYRPGIANFADATLLGGERATNYIGNDEHIVSPETNTLDAVAPFTRRLEARDALGETPGLGFLKDFLMLINPVPSGLIDPGRIGLDLAEYMGTVGNVGLTSPALADLFYAFDYWGLLVLVALGAVLGYFDRLAVYRPGVVANLAILLSVIGIGVSLHSSIRAWTRPLLYAWVLVIVARHFRSRAAKNHARKPQDSLSMSW